jgi:hypothetical protein
LKSFISILFIKNFYITFYFSTANKKYFAIIVNEYIRFKNMLNKVAHFNSGIVNANFTEHEDGSISKKALVLASGNWVDNRGRSHNFSEDRIYKIAENSNSALDNGVRIPIAKEHGKTVDDLVGDVNDLFVVKEITEEDLPNKKNKNLIGKLGIFCEDMLIRSKDYVEKVKGNLVRELSPGIDIVADKIKEISLVGHPAIPGMSLFSTYDGAQNELQGVYSLDEAEALAQTEDELKEEFMQLSCLFYKVLTNILQAPEEELGEEGQMLLEQAFADYELRIRGLFGVGEMESDEDGDDYMETEQSPYSLQQTPYMEAPYSLYAVDSAEFAFGSEWLKKQGKGLANVKNIGANAFGYARRGKWEAAKGTLNNYFTKPGGGLNMKRAVGGALATGAAGYGAYRLGKAGLNAVGIGRDREEQRPWYRRNPFA